ncbi:MAG: BCCT family transporter [Alphaproteobacteria bacterium]
MSENIKEMKGGTPKIDKVALGLSAGFLSAFVLFGLFNGEGLSAMVGAGFGMAIKYFGAYWQLLLLATFLIGLYLSFTREGRVVLGAVKTPEISRFTWTSIIMCTLLAGGGVFWAAGEPMAQYLSPPPLFGAQENPFDQAVNALAQSFIHWGFLAWAIVGTLSAIVLMHLHYDKGLPLKPRTLLYPLLGDRVLGTFGSVIDAFCMIAVAAGTIGPIGFLGLQLSYGLNQLIGVENAFSTQVVIILIAMGIYIASAVSGLNKGIQLLSRGNVILAAGLMLFILLFGPTAFIVDAYTQGVGTMINNFFPMTLFRADTGWLGWWTVFFWGWFMGYGPMMAVFVARISRGRTIRDLFLTIGILAPLVTMFWFTIVGGSGLFYEINNPGTIAAAFKGFNLPATLLAITQQLPLGSLISVLFLILTTIFIVTTGDSMSYTMSLVSTENNVPCTKTRVLWGVLMGLSAMLLISVGSGSISALQSFIVITAVPVGLILTPSLWDSVNIARKMADKQKL